MTDGRGGLRLSHYFYRAGQHPNRPGLITGDVNGDQGRIAVPREMEAIGLAAFYRDSTTQRKLWDGIPDSEGLTEAEIDSMPPYVRAFRCGKQYEKGDICGPRKFTVVEEDPDCEKRRYRVSWHPGWKFQALEGHYKTLFMMELIDSSLQYLDANMTDPALLLQQLKVEEDADYQQFKDAPLPQISSQFELPDFDLEVFYRETSLCHTARLPAIARFNGAITDTTPGSQDDYDIGISMEEAYDTIVPDGGMMPLAYKQQERQKCIYPVNIDYKDMFYVSIKSPGYNKLVLPNNAEKSIYGHSNFHGYIAICASACGFGKVSIAQRAFK